MGDNISQYRAAIGHFHLRCMCDFNNYSYFGSIINLAVFTSMYISRRVILLSNDIETNPGPVTNNPKNNPINICHSNVRSIVAELDSNYKRLNMRPPKIIELESFVSENNISIMCLTESSLPEKS